MVSGYVTPDIDVAQCPSQNHVMRSVKGKWNATIRSSHHITKSELSFSILFQNSFDLAALFPEGKYPRSPRTSRLTESIPGSLRPCTRTVDWVASSPRSNRFEY